MKPTSSGGRIRRSACVIGVLACVVLLAACASAAPAHRSGTGSQPLFTPYVDVTSGTPIPPGEIGPGARTQYALSFVLARGNGCAPVWGDSTPIEDPTVQQDVSELRRTGASVMVSSGGESGSYLENACHSPESLAKAYETALTAAHAKALDLDIEQPVPVGVVADAVAMVQRAQPVDVTLTLPVADATQGLDPMAVPLLDAVAARGIRVTVNAMVMDFPYQGSWRAAMLGAAEAAHAQIASAWHVNSAEAYRRLGLTVMLGRNDTGSITTLADAEAVREYGRSHGIAALGMWSLARDNGNCPGRVAATDECSGIAQQPGQFAAALSGTAAHRITTNSTQGTR